jgi:hypothetical protein
MKNHIKLHAGDLFNKKLKSELGLIFILTTFKILVFLIYVDWSKFLASRRITC